MERSPLAHLSLPVQDVPAAAVAVLPARQACIVPEMPLRAPIIEAMTALTISRTVLPTDKKSCGYFYKLL